MAHTAPANYSNTEMSRRADSGALNAYNILHVAFVILPLVAGIDKFFHVLTDWDKYLAPIATSTTHLAARTFMMGVGVVEIIAGLIVAFWPRVGGYVVGLWLAGIIVNLALNPVHYWDVAARDFGLLLGAISLGSLSAWAARVKEESA